MNGSRADMSKTEAIKMEINSEINHAISIINKFGSFFKKGDDIDSNSSFGEGKYYTDLLPNGSSQVTEEFLRKLVEKMFETIQKSMDRNEKILTFQYPQELRAKLDLEIPAEPLSLDQILADCENTMKYSVRTAHPRFFNQISQGLDLVSLAGEWVTAATNTNMFTYEVAPVYNLIEHCTLQKMRSIIGWTEPGDGLFSPGGSLSNLYAVQAAKHYYFPDTKQDGLFNMPKLIIFTSEHSHYSIHKAASILGFGLNQIKNVQVDATGRMRPDALERMILESIDRKELPFMVCLTSGTTVLGAFDPIEPVSAICKKYNMWLHIDAAWGGGALLSKKHRHLMSGIEKADSVTWNPHKLMGALLQCSAFLIKHTGILQNCNEMNATYLFQQDKHYDMTYDTGDKTIQCGRHVDVFKVWLMWRAKGDSGFEKHVDRLLELASILYQELKRRPNFMMVLENPVFTNVCFWYVPKSIQSMDKDSDEFKLKLHKVAPKIKERMMLKGSLMVGYQPLDDKPNFFRMIISNAATQVEDIMFMLDEIEELGRDL